MLFVTQFTHVSRHPRFKNTKQTNKIFRENCFEIVVSDLWKKIKYAHESALKKIQKLKTTKNWKS